MTMLTPVDHEGLESIAERMSKLATHDPHRLLVSCGDQHVTAIQLEHESNRLAHYFQRLGVETDDFVTIAMPNGIRYVESVLAIWKAGAVPAPVSPRLPGTELESIIELTDPSLVLGVDPDRLPRRVCLPVDYSVPIDIDASPHVYRFARYSRAPTSGGSTGRPKLIIDKRPAAVYSDPLLPHDSEVVIPGPLYHTAPFALVTRSVLQGNHTTIFERFDPEATLATVHRTRATFLYAVPTMMSRMWKLPTDVKARYDLSSLSTLFHSAAPCPEWLKRAWIEVLGDAVVEMYSSSEGAAKFIIKGHEWLMRPGSVGRPRPGDAVRILDDEGREVPVGTIGNVYMRSEGDRDFVYKGADAPARIDGFVTVGDMGHVDSDGYLYLADRRKDLIIRGGANIFPAEVEATLEAHPAVRSVAVVGIPDDDLGQRVHAVVDSPEGVPVDQLRAFVAARLVSYKCPTSYEFVDGPVRDEAGKVRRSALLG